ncbi:hypothetical protein ENSA7_18450 [Enhygromyxa salina]|uniref:Uncharacterized protein n=1 Tax=Enhygromyxa salina TaxID=215803 RepID=A0A2S9YU46_9BACT|nr:hypothetical protein ENSA7_18450 [Enhygromyxa salina]
MSRLLAAFIAVCVAGVGGTIAVRAALDGGWVWSGMVVVLSIAALFEWWRQRGRGPDVADAADNMLVLLLIAMTVLGLR